MPTIDRINAILQKLGGATIAPPFLSRTSPEVLKPGHLILDVIDHRVGIITSWQYGRYGKRAPAPVGERLRRLERHVFKEEAPPFFWLGAEAGAHG